MDDETAVTENYENLSQKKEHRKKRRKLLVTELLLDFSKNTTLHGLRYVTQIGLSTLEKIFWFLMFVISVVLCFFLIQQVWFKWCDSPVIVTINERMMSVEEVPFPSVTICPQMKNKKSQYEYAKQYLKYKKYVMNGFDEPLNDTIEKELKMLDDAMLVCDAYISYHHVLKCNITNESTIHNIEKIAPIVKDTIFSYTLWRGVGYSSIEMFNEVLTSEGVCFTFNTVQQENMFKNESIQNQYLYVKPTKQDKQIFLYFLWPRENKKVYPRRGRENGGIPDLVVMLNQNVNDSDGLCNNLYSGYKVYLHHPDDMPQSSLYYYPVLPGQVTSLALKFSAMSTSESLMKHPPELRQCYSSSDRELRYFKTYTLSNCKLECLSIYTYKRCGCVSFHMPHTNSSEICPSKKKTCVKYAKIEALTSKKYVASMGDVCNCLPSCNSVEYDADVLKTSFDWKTYEKTMFNSTIDGLLREASKFETCILEPPKLLIFSVFLSLGTAIIVCVVVEVNYARPVLFSNFNTVPDAAPKASASGSAFGIQNKKTTNYNVSRLEVFFKEPRFVSMRRSELFGLTDFLANCGGLLGLFLGFSFLSIIEVIYFCTFSDKSSICIQKIPFGEVELMMKTIDGHRNSSMVPIARLWYSLKKDKGEKKECDKVSAKNKNKNKDLKKY